jgi:spore coat protein CotH
MVDVEAGEKKKQNVIIYRLDEPEEHEQDKDSDEVEKIIKHINPEATKEDIKTVKRIGQRSEGKNRPVLVKLKDPQTAKEILTNAKKLKGSEWNVSIEVDRTKKAREYVKYIREKAIREKGDEAQNFLFKVVGEPGQERVVTVRKKTEGEEETE